MVCCTTCKVRFTIAGAELYLMHLFVKLGGTSKSGKRPNTPFTLGAGHRTSRSDDHHVNFGRLGRALLGVCSHSQHLQVMRWDLGPVDPHRSRLSNWSAPGVTRWLPSPMVEVGKTGVRIVDGLRLVEWRSCFWHDLASLGHSLCGYCR